MRILIAFVFVFMGCSIAPGGKKKSGQGEALPPGIHLDFKVLQRPFKTQDFKAERFYLDGQSLNFDSLRLLSTGGLGWSVNPASIDQVEFTDTGVLFDPLNLVMLVESKHLWRMELDTVMRTVEPIDTSKELDLEKELAAYEAKASTEELSDEGQLNLVGISTDIAVTRAKDKLIQYVASSSAGMTRSEIPPPEGKEDWSSIKPRSFGVCKEKCLWILGEESIYLFFPTEGMKFGSGTWHSFESKLSFADSDWQKFVSISMPILPNETNEPVVTGPAFLTTTEGIYLSTNHFDQVFSSRIFDPNQKYEWNSVKDLAKDYCVGCHTGYLGLDVESTWVERKNVILKYILPEEKDASYTMPKKDSLEYKSMSDDERLILASWLRSKGADEDSVEVIGEDEVEGPKKFELSAELLAVIDGNGYGKCLNCHGAGVDDMRLKSWWLNPVRNQRLQANGQPLNGKEAAIASLTTTNVNAKMPRGATLSAAQIAELEALFRAVDLE